MYIAYFTTSGKELTQRDCEVCWHYKWRPSNGVVLFFKRDTHTHTNKLPHLTVYMYMEYSRHEHMICIDSHSKLCMETVSEDMCIYHILYTTICFGGHWYNWECILVCDRLTKTSDALPSVLGHTNRDLTWDCNHMSPVIPYIQPRYWMSYQ